MRPQQEKATADNRLSRQAVRAQQRQQKKQLKHLIGKDETAGIGSVADREFFLAHPERNLRIRPATFNEVESLGLLGQQMQADDDLFFWNIIKQIEPGVRMKLGVWLPPLNMGLSPDDVPEHVIECVLRATHPAASA